MSPTSRREFLAAAGGTLAASPPSPTPKARRLERGARSAHLRPSRRTGRSTVEGVHAYTDRVSVVRWRLIRFHVSSSLPYELQVCRLGLGRRRPRSRPDPSFLWAVTRGRSSLSIRAHIFGRDKPLDDRTMPCRPDARGLDSPLADGRTPGDPRPVRRTRIVRLRPVRQRRWIARLLCGRRRSYVDGRMLQERHRTSSDGGQSARSETLPGQHAQFGASNHWHHVVARFDGKTKQIWVDGREVASAGRRGCRPSRFGRAAHRRGRPGTVPPRISLTPTSPCRRSTARLCRRPRSRPASRRAPVPSGGPRMLLLACWPLD